MLLWQDVEDSNHSVWYASPTSCRQKMYIRSTGNRQPCAPYWAASFRHNGKHDSEVHHLIDSTHSYQIIGVNPAHKPPSHVFSSTSGTTLRTYHCHCVVLGLVWGGEAGQRKFPEKSLQGIRGVKIRLHMF